MSNGASSYHSFTLAETLLNGRVLITAAINFCSIIGGFGVQLWLPQIVKGFGLSNFQVGFVNAIPSVRGRCVGAVGAQFRRRRGPHLARRADNATGSGGPGARRLGKFPDAVTDRPDSDDRGHAGFPGGLLGGACEFPGRTRRGSRHRADRRCRQSGRVCRPLLDRPRKEATDSYAIALLVLGGFLTCSTLLPSILGNPARRGKGRLAAQGAGRG
jgi:hypothetical protein